MSWEIKEHFIDEFLHVNIKMDDGYHVYYSHKVDLPDLIASFDLNASNLIDGRHTYNSGEQILVCRATNTDQNTLTDVKIPVNSVHDDSDLGKHIWLLLLIEQDTNRVSHKVKRTSSKVSDLYPHK